MLQCYWLQAWTCRKAYACASHAVTPRTVCAYSLVMQGVMTCQLNQHGVEEAVQAACAGRHAGWGTESCLMQWSAGRRWLTTLPRPLQVLREEDAAVRIYISMGDNSGYQFKTHPKLDKSLYSQDSILGLKDPAAAFPAGSPLGVLKWRYQVGPAPVTKVVAAGPDRTLGVKGSAAVSCAPFLTGRCGCGISSCLQAGGRICCCGCLLLLAQAATGAETPYGCHPYNRVQGAPEWRLSDGAWLKGCCGSCCWLSPTILSSPDVPAGAAVWPSAPSAFSAAASPCIAL